MEVEICSCTDKGIPEGYHDPLCVVAQKFMIEKNANWYRWPERRQFDVSKLNPISHHSDPVERSEYSVKLEVLEAWNAGTIEELLESWVEE
jgi:hypothetical protein